MSELCNFRYLVPRERVKSSQHAVITADEELLSVLEEVIMFTFQQLVYHLTKILYGALPAVLEVNPFQGEIPFVAGNAFINQGSGS